MGISEFKARCIAVLREAHRDGTPLIVTRRGLPLVRIEPVADPTRARRLGQLRERTGIRCDLVGADFADEWELDA